MSKIKIPKDGKIALNDLNAGAIGSTDMKKNRKQAEHLILVVRLSEREKLEHGYKWMFKDKRQSW